MTVLHLADEGEAADLSAFLSRLLRYDRGAAVRLQAAGTALAVFGRPPSFEVLAIRAVRLAKPYEDGLDVTLDVTVSAGELLESVDESACTVTVPSSVTGPPWAGVLPPRGGWQPEAGLPAPEDLRAAVASAVAEFRSRTEELAPKQRTRAQLDRIGREIWSRTLGDTDLPVRAAHAAQSLGFLPPELPTAPEPPTEPKPPTAPKPPSAPEQSTGSELSTAPVAHAASAGPSAAGNGGTGQRVVLLRSGSWLRLRTPYGSVAVRRAGAAGELGVSVRGHRHGTA